MSSEAAPLSHADLKIEAEDWFQSTPNPVMSDVFGENWGASRCGWETNESVMSAGSFDEEPGEASNPLVGQPTCKNVAGIDQISAPRRTPFARLDITARQWSVGGI